jgi:thiosulfate/3-mercaptopyruvate sulfurtransferase
MKQFLKNISVIIAFLFVLPGAYAQLDIISAKDYAVLAKKDKNAVTVFAGKEKNYKANHIKGSIMVSYKDAIKEGDPKGLMLDPEDLAKFFGENGVSNTNTIIVYDNGSQKYSTRMYWLLKYMGAEDVKILHKDYDQWRKARIMVTSAPATGKATTFTPNVNPSILANMSDVETALGNTGAVVVDNRKSDEFDGSAEKSEGHIEGAVNLFWEDLMTDTKAFKSKEELQAIAEKAGITPDKEVIFYCNTGILAAVGYVAFKNILDYPNVKLYDGAVEEWKTKHKLVK